MIFFGSPEFCALLFIAALAFREVVRTDSPLIAEISLAIINALFSLMLLGFSLEIFMILIIWSSMVYSIAIGLEILRKRGLHRSALTLKVSAIMALTLFLAISKYGVCTSQSSFAGICSNLQLPFIIGASYLTFKAIHLLIEIDAGSFPVPGMLRFFNFLFFFACFASGPIDRFDRFQNDLQSLLTRLYDYREASYAIFRICLGLCKVFALAPLMLEYAFPQGYGLPATANLNQQEHAIESLTFSHFMMQCYAFSFFIYFDFSGYTDIAVGAGRLLGIRVPENFRSPFSATSIQEFWNRWHITLSTWVRDYIFFPLEAALLRLTGLGQNLITPTIAAVVSFSVIGVWHGFTNNFLVWGVAHGLLVSINSAWRVLRRKTTPRLDSYLQSSKIWKAISWFVTFNTVALLNAVWALPLPQFISIVQSLILTD